VLDRILLCNHAANPKQQRSHDHNGSYHQHTLLFCISGCLDGNNGTQNPALIAEPCYLRFIPRIGNILYPMQPLSLPDRHPDPLGRGRHIDMVDLVFAP
jgi:hypothetical protein